MTILVRFGMSGKFQFTSKDEMDKHAHLNFYTAREGNNSKGSFCVYAQPMRDDVTL